MNASTRLRYLYTSLSSKLKTSRSSLFPPVRKNISTQRDASEIPMRPATVPWTGYASFVVPLGLSIGAIFYSEYLKSYDQLLADCANNSILPAVPVEAATDHCARVELRGHFDFSREAVIVSRAKKTGTENVAPHIVYDRKLTPAEDDILRKKEWGHWVITPFVLDSGKTILVNRGWIPCASIDPSSPERRPQKYPTVLTGYLVKMDEEPDLIYKLLMHRPDEGRWSYREISSLSEKLNTEKIFVDLDNSGYIGKNAPIPNQLQLSCPEFFNWYRNMLFGLAFFTGIAWFYKYIGPIKPFAAAW